MKSINTTCCLKFEKKGIKVCLVDNQSNDVLRQKSLVCDFEIIDNAGLIINPIKTASFLQKNVNELGLPKKIRVSLGLEFVSLSRLVLPPVSGLDLDRMITDEAERESPFSFTNEKIAVAYQISREKTIAGGVSGMEVLAVTTPQNIIDKISEVFQNTNLTLEAVAPSILGLKQYLSRQRLDTTQPFALVFVAANNAEFYVWEGQFAASTHFIRFGAAEPEELKRDIMTSLEHLNRNASGAPLSRIVMIGEKRRLELDNDGYHVEYLPGDEWADLAGLAAISKIPDNLSFISQVMQKTPADGGINRFWPFLLGGIVLLNVGIGWNLWSAKHRLVRLEKENEQLRDILNLQLSGLEKESRVTAGHYKIHLLLERIREVVSQNMMFERLVLDVEAKNMQLEGFCLGQDTVNEFILDLSMIKGVQSVENIKVVEQKRGDLKGYVFSLQANLKDI